MTQDYSAVIDMPFSRLAIAADEAVTGIEFVGTDVPLLGPRNSLTEEVCRQLGAYWNDPAFRFSLPLAERDTGFRLRVWAALREIPVGQVLSYGQLASQLGTAARAVGGACRHNPIPLLTPCHRVVAAHSIGGFSGQAEHGAAQDRVAIKRWLLRHEGAI